MQGFDRRKFMHRCAWCTAGLGLFGPNTWAREGVDVGEQSKFAKLVPAEEIERNAQQQYKQMASTCCIYFSRYPYFWNIKRQPFRID